MGLYNKSFHKLDIDLNEVKRINEDEDMITNSFIYKYRDIILKKVLVLYRICNK